MTDIKQSFAWWAFGGRGVAAPEMLRAAREIGYSGVELIPQELWNAARDAGLRVVTHGGHASIESGLNDPAQHDRIADEIEAALALAVKNDIPNLIVFAGSRRAGLTEAEGAAHTANGLRRVARGAENAGVTLLLELLNSRRDHRGYQGDHTEWGAGVCEAVGSPRVKLLYDVYHMQIMEGDIINTITAHRVHIAHYHTAGVPGRRDLGDAQELNYPAIVRAIAGGGFDGYIGHEFMPMGEPVAALRAAFELCAGA